MSKLDKKVALITGGSSGIGLSIAEHFVAEGAYVFITGRRQQLLDEAVKCIGEKNVTAIQADASKLADFDKVYNVIKESKHRLDILVVNAGFGCTSALETVTENDFDVSFDTNVKGVLFAVQKALPVFNDGGSIIMIGSIASFKGYAGYSVYSATKAAVRSFARCWTNDLKQRKIRVNIISPGSIDTLLERSTHESEEEQKKYIDLIIAATPMGRQGEPREVAKAAVFLASDDSSYVTGIELCVDGGMGQI